MGLALRFPYLGTVEGATPVAMAISHVEYVA